MSIAITILSILLAITVFLSLIKNDFWIFKALEYPRFQKWLIASLLIALWVVMWVFTGGVPIYALVLLLICWFYLSYKIFPYTPLAKKQLVTLKCNQADSAITIYVANVLQDNNQYKRIIDQARNSGADIYYFMETNGAWANALDVLRETHPHVLAQPLENTYGLMLYSRKPLIDAGVHYLVKDDIPSVAFKIAMPGGRNIQCWGIHPEPPVPQESLYSTAKDKELMMIGLKAKDCKLPCLVLGDLNDVAWSYTTELFIKTSGLLDPRRGRGFYSTFSAFSWFMRYPLDYIFCSPHFGLVSMKRLPKNGSDHYATLTSFCLMPMKPVDNNPETPELEDIKEAVEIATQDVKE